MPPRDVLGNHDTSYLTLVPVTRVNIGALERNRNRSRGALGGAPKKLQ